MWPIGRNMVTTHIVSSRLRLFRATSLPRNVHGDDSSADDNDNRCCLSCAARRNQSTDPPEASSRWVAIFVVRYTVAQKLVVLQKPRPVGLGMRSITESPGFFVSRGGLGEFLKVIN